MSFDSAQWVAALTRWQDILEQLSTEGVPTNGDLAETIRALHGTRTFAEVCGALRAHTVTNTPSASSAIPVMRAMSETWLNLDAVNGDQLGIACEVVSEEPGVAPEVRELFAFAANTIFEKHGTATVGETAVNLERAIALSPLLGTESDNGGTMPHMGDTHLCAILFEALADVLATDFQGTSEGGRYELQCDFVGTQESVAAATRRMADANVAQIWTSIVADDHQAVGGTDDQQQEVSYTLRASTDDPAFVLNILSQFGYASQFGFRDGWDHDG